MTMVYVVKHDVSDVESVVVYVTTDKSKAEEIVETFISVDTEWVDDVIENVVTELCRIEEYPMDVIIPDLDLD